MVTPVSAHHKYHQQYVELHRSLAWLGELQLTSASAERGSAGNYMQTIWHLIISSGRHLTKNLISVLLSVHHEQENVCSVICMLFSVLTPVTTFTRPASCLLGVCVAETGQH